MILNKDQLIANAATPALKKVRCDVLEMLDHVLVNIDPYHVVKQHVVLTKNILSVTTKSYDLTKFKNIYVVGGGKAVFDMARALEEILGSKITAGHVNVVKGTPRVLKRISYFEVGHPIPNGKGIKGTQKMLKLVSKATKDDLVIALISGGGSACMPFPVDGVSLQEKIQLTQLFLKSNATIHEINTVRKHLSLWKGGGLAHHAHPATLVGIFISDIVGDDFDTQASGPTAPDTTTFADAIAVLKRKNIWDHTPESIRTYLTKGLHDVSLETPKPDVDSDLFKNVFNVTLCNHRTSLMSVVDKAKELGYHTLPLTSFLEGESREVATVLVSIAKETKLHNSPVKTPVVVVASGEIPVSVHGKGYGGRNQEAVLSAALKLLPGITFVSFATDGVDGLTPQPVAGAIADEFTQKKACEHHLDMHEYLTNNDSYTFFNKLGEHLVTGITGTNVGDLIVIVVI